MADFYVLPSRQQLGQRYGEFLSSLFPGITYAARDWAVLADSLASLVEAAGNHYVVYREDLDERISVKDALLRDFGATLDDDITEIGFGPDLNQFLRQRWAKEGTRQAA